MKYKKHAVVLPFIHSTSFFSLRQDTQNGGNEMKLITFSLIHSMQYSSRSSEDIFDNNKKIKKKKTERIMKKEREKKKSGTNITTFLFLPLQYKTIGKKRRKKN